MMYAFNETYDSALAIPISVRKWLIKRWNKQKEHEAAQNQPSTEEPLTPEERRKMIQNAVQQEQIPKPPAEFLTSRRNHNG